MPFSPNSLVEVINRNKDKKLVATKIIETNPKILPVIPKLISNRDTVRSINNISKLQINRNILESIYNKIKSTKQNNKNIIKLFPDIELAIQILVSSILSPKKMTDININYKLNKSFIVDSTIIGNILEKLKKYVNDKYGLEEKLPEILREALFNTGAYVLAVIPESSVDEVINTDLLPSYSTEEFKQKSDLILHNITKPINIITPSEFKKEISLESNVTKQTFVDYITSNSVLKITDNINILKFSKIKEKISKALISNSLKKNIAISAESLEKLDYLDIFRQKNSNIINKEVEFIKTKTETKRKSIGTPMVIKIPTESIIPIFIPGDETAHIGYFILLDEAGKPINSDIRDVNIDQLNNTINQSFTQQSNLTPVQKAYNNLIGNEQSDIDVNQLFDLYKDVLEKQIYTSIKNSLYGSNIEIANKNDIYFLMFTRALNEQKTTLLFVPKELVVYFAFYYNELGIGKSLLDNLSILSSLRAILLFSKTMAYAKQSIDVTKVNISLDPNDPDPEKTIEQIQDSVLKLRQNYFPLGINNPVDLLNWIQRAGLQFSYENNPLLPNIKIDFENVDLQHTIPSSELEEDLRKQTILALGLSPETIDNGFSPEFATTVVNNNILLSKRIIIYQKTLVKHLSKLLNILIYNDEELRTELKKDILENINSIVKTLSDEENQLYIKNKEEFIDYFLNKFAENVYIDLPKPENTNITNLSAEYDVYKENLEKVIETTISSEALSLIGDGSGLNLDEIKNVYKNYLLRKWCIDNNFLVEATDISSNNQEEVDNLLNSIINHLTHTSRNGVKLVSLLDKFKLAINADLSKLSSSNTESTSLPNSESESTSSDLGNKDEQIDDTDISDDIDLSL